jgi:hypothetical protein
MYVTRLFFIGAQLVANFNPWRLVRADRVAPLGYVGQVGNTCAAVGKRRCHSIKGDSLGVIR